MWRRLLLGGVVLAVGGPVVAHPHVWIDTRIEVILNDRNEATGLRIGWTYDELYSLSVVGDMGLDPDWDGNLTPEETARLSGFDMNWDPDFPGDTYALLGETPLELSRPQDWTAGYADGKITTTHLRTFAEPVPLDTLPLVVQAYDPGYYVAYAIPFPPVVSGGLGCTARTFVPDLDEAQQQLLAALSEYAPDVDLQAEFPAVGAKFAEEVRVTCTAP
ncbi:DUF1007 family protein [Tabrizicola caldifontis]|uniref:DUF1007 family protein n=1 Tax=Tabrizicola caldifontis TaxID=2528036 RepID=UPI0014369330|nr:DUF1007 family protein [Rhodobacter sp. YIM 73028]